MIGGVINYFSIDSEIEAHLCILALYQATSAQRVPSRNVTSDRMCHTNNRLKSDAADQQPTIIELILRILRISQFEELFEEFKILRISWLVTGLWESEKARFFSFLLLVYFFILQLQFSRIWTRSKIVWRKLLILEKTEAARSPLNTFAKHLVYRVHTRVCIRMHMLASYHTNIYTFKK